MDTKEKKNINWKDPKIEEKGTIIKEKERMKKTPKTGIKGQNV